MPFPVRRKRGGPLEHRLRDREPPHGPGAALQLAIGREGVGLELSQPIALGPITLLHARTRMVGVGFPLDVSGGVERFRHRRTTLETIGLAIEHGRAERWLTSLTENLLTRGPCEARIAWVAPPDVGVGEAQSEREEHLIWSTGNVRIELWAERAIAAFDLAIAPAPSGLSAIAHRARSIGTDKPATAIAGALLWRIARAFDGEASGLRIDLRDPTKGAAMEAFVLRGARIPTRDDLVMVRAHPEVDRFEVELRRGDTPAAPSSLYLALDELDRIIGEGDIANVAGDYEKARELYVRALDRAPRHRAILTRLAEIDGTHAERAEAALSWLRDAQKGRTRRALDGNDLGRMLLFAFLNERIGARGRARGAWDRAASEAMIRGEPRIAARALSCAAAATRDDDPQLSSLLDRALAADPGEIDARWRRASLHIRGGDDVRALEDVEHLEARSRGREARRRTLMRAAQLWHEAGRPDRAIPAWERAVRHVPNDRAVVAGLGTALLAAGETPRAIGLLSHATTLPGDRADLSLIVLELARALAERVGDLPAAIARLREIADDDAHAAYARALEGACRLQLGDQVGAERAYAIAADLVERRGAPATDSRALRELLSGAARVSRTEGRLALAMRLGMVALSLDPTDTDLQALVRLLGRSLVREPAEEPTTDPGIIAGNPLTLALDDEPLGESDDQHRAEALLARVKSDPNDHAAIDELVGVLGRLGRDAELFALLSARWEDATADERVTMIPRQRAVLERLANAADSQGRTIEAQLYRDALRALR